MTKPQTFDNQTILDFVKASDPNTAVRAEQVLYLSQDIQHKEIGDGVRLVIASWIPAIRLDSTGESPLLSIPMIHNLSIISFE